MDNFKIGVFFSDGKKWTLLPDTSKMISEQTIIPVHGDRVSTVGDDFKLMNLDSISDFRSVLTVKDRLHGYSNCQLALICDYQKW